MDQAVGRARRHQAGMAKREELVKHVSRKVIVVGVVASSRGRSGFGYFLLSLLLSPLLGLILAVALPSKLPSSGGQSAGEPISASTHVTKKGTVVRGHRQTNDDGTKANNWSSRPNVNPDTGKRGTVDPNK